MTRGVAIFWAIFVGIIALDYSKTGHPRVEPAPFAMGSGQIPSGGHCSGK